MDVVVTARHCELSERFRDHVADKLGRLADREQRLTAIPRPRSPCAISQVLDNGRRPPGELRDRSGKRGGGDFRYVRHWTSQLPAGFEKPAPTIRKAKVEQSGRY